MPKLSLNLQAKILLSSFVLVLPLAVALTFVYQYGSSQIETAQREDLGVTTAAPLWDALLAWQLGATANDKVTEGLKDFAARVAGEGAPLVPAADATTGATWTKPDALLTAAGTTDGANPAQFAQFHKSLVSDVLVLADRSGLVLDPDLDSYYLILAMYQTVPNMVEKLTDLRPLFAVTSAKLNDNDRLLLYSRARELQFQAGYLADQVARSTRAAAASRAGAIPGYVAEVTDAATAIVDIGTALEAAAGGPALGGAFEPAAFESKTLALLSRLRTFLAEGTKGLEVMLDRRIASAQGLLLTAFLAAGLGLVLGGGLLLFVVGGIRRRVFGVVGSLATLAQGDLTREVPAALLASGDEMARLAASVHTLQTDLKGQVKGIETAVVDLGAMGSTLGASSEQSSAAVEEMAAITATVARAAETQSQETAHANEIVAAMIERIGQSNELTQGMATQFFLFSQSMEANRNRIRDVAMQAQSTGELAEGLDRTGDEGERSLSALTRSVQGVVAKTGEIQEIVQFILDIADRTNLLSMNAAIEAAHAGSAGRGFSIVADEIRKLAEVSSKQAQTIQGLLDAITGVVDRTLADSQTTAHSFQSLRQAIANVKDASTTIAQKMSAQEDEDERLSEGLHTFAEFYGRLSEALDHQIAESKNVKTVLDHLEDTGKEISLSMHEQKIGMEQSTEASIQVRETALNLTQVIGVLEAQVSRFKT
jgi:methyl-accepting chemotaxis protein